MGNTTLDYGDSVKVVYPPNEQRGLGLAFNGQTGRVLYSEKVGRERFYRVKLDKPVLIDGLGPVSDDLWTRKYLRKQRS